MTFITAGLHLMLFQLVTGQKLKNPVPNVGVIPHGGQVDALCQYTPSKISKFNLTLLKGSEKQPVCVMYTNGTDIIFYHWQDQVPCELRNSNGTKSFVLSNLETKHTENYECHLQNYYPPPLVNKTLSSVHIHVYEPPTETCNQLPGFLMWIFLGIAVFLFFCCIVTLYLLIRKNKLNQYEPSTVDASNEHNSVYMPMAPVSLPRCPTLDVNGGLK